MDVRWRFVRRVLLVSVLAICSVSISHVQGQGQQGPHVVPATPTTRAITWTPAGGPVGGFVLSVASSPGFATDHTLFAGGIGGVFLSSDAGHTWGQANRGLVNQSIEQLVISPNYRRDHRIFALTTTGRLLISSSITPTWTAVTHGLGQHPIVSLAVSPNYAANQHVLAGTHDGLVLASVDGGVTWTIAQRLPHLPAISQVAFSPAYASDHTLYVVTNQGLYRSTMPSNWVMLPAETTTGGSAASAAPLALRSIGFSPSFAVDHTLFGGSDHVSISHDGGTTWHYQVPFIQGSITQILTSPTFPRDHLIYAISASSSSSIAGSLYRSTNGGATWATVGSLLTNSYVYQIALSPNFALDHRLFAGGAGPGVLASDDRGQTWKAINRGFNGQLVNDVAISSAFGTDHTLFVTTLGSGLFVSRNGGHDWHEVNQSVNMRFTLNSVALSPAYATDHHVFVAAVEAYLQSTDSGKKWDYQYASLPNQDVGTVRASPTFQRDRTIVCGGSLVDGTGAFHATVFATFDGGASWQELDSGVHGDIVKAVAISPAHAKDHTIFVGAGPLHQGGAPGGVFVTHDDGQSWQAIGKSMHNLDVTALVLSPQYPVDQTLVATTNRGLFVSPDGGTTWQGNQAGLSSAGTFNTLAISPAFSNDHTIFAGSDTGIYESTDGGQSWMLISQSMDNPHTGVLAVSPQFATDRLLFAGTDDSMWIGHLAPSLARPLAVPTAVLPGTS